MATMADIAERAGVALSTVSYVLSGKRSVSEETKQRVYRAIAERTLETIAGLGREERAYRLHSSS